MNVKEEPIESMRNLTVGGLLDMLDPPPEHNDSENQVAMEEVLGLILHRAGEFYVAHEEDLRGEIMRTACRAVYLR
jgi:hypothetical protein